MTRGGRQPESGGIHKHDRRLRRGASIYPNGRNGRRQEVYQGCSTGCLRLSPIIAVNPAVREVHGNRHFPVTEAYRGSRIKTAGGDSEFTHSGTIEPGIRGGICNIQLELRRRCRAGNGDCVNTLRMQQSGQARECRQSGKKLLAEAHVVKYTACRAPGSSAAALLF